MRGGEEPPKKTLWKKAPDASGTTMICETIGDNVLILPKNRNGESPIVQNGTIVSFAPYPEQAFKAIWVDPLNAKGFNIPSSGWIEKIIAEGTGDPVPNWNEYQEL